ncbi:MAG TPA: carboxypeptidase-like regulatory domain-containing protein [Flavobacterium sp.]|nr:carboxypeptidase-like regulatory domain-containing protein [Flavobacterium sp.]
MMRWCLVVWGWMSVAAFGQTVTGKVIEAGSDAPVAYTSIGVVGRNIGTVSGSDGSFSLSLPEGVEGTVRISALGYVSFEASVADFLKRGNNTVIQLKPDVKALREVTVRHFANADEWGNTRLTRKELVDAGFVNNKLGNELGMVIKARQKPVKLMKFKAQVAYNRYHEMRFRLNVYAMKNGLPGESLLADNIIVTSTIRKGVLEVDLSDYGIVAEGDFFISLEWIEDLGEGGLHFYADYSGPKIITRAAAQGKWNEQDDLSFAFTVSVRY